MGLEDDLSGARHRNAELAARKQAESAVATLRDLGEVKNDLVGVKVKVEAVTEDVRKVKDDVHDIKGDVHTLTLNAENTKRTLEGTVDGAHREPGIVDLIAQMAHAIADMRAAFPVAVDAAVATFSVQIEEVRKDVKEHTQPITKALTAIAVGVSIAVLAGLFMGVITELSYFHVLSGGK